MSKKAYTRQAIIMVIILISVSLVLLHQKGQEQSARRYHLLCETLQPGMSKEEVLNTLGQVGYFSRDEADRGDGDIYFSVKYSDPRINDEYGYFQVAFENYKYIRGYDLSGMDSSGIILCDFSNLMESNTASPNQP